MTPAGQLTLDYSLDAAAERDQPWSDAAARWIQRQPVGQTFSSDTLREACGSPRGSGCSVGSAIHKAQKRGEIVYTGQDVRSVRAERRGGWIRVWVRV